MKVFIPLLVGMLTAGSMFGQSVVFANTASPAFGLDTNNVPGTSPGVMSGVNQYRIGLYVGFPGTSLGSLVLAGLATNLSTAPNLAGYFSGETPFFLPTPYAVGDTITFQVRAWAFAGGMSYEEARYRGFETGTSSLGFVTLGGGLMLPGALFGTSAGQIGSFTIALP